MKQYNMKRVGKSNGGRNTGLRLLRKKIEKLELIPGDFPCL